MAEGSRGDRWQEVISIISNNIISTRACPARDHVYLQGVKISQHALGEGVKIAPRTAGLRGEEEQGQCGLLRDTQPSLPAVLDLDLADLGL